ncbi:hypothetical protein HYPDE_30373 [Hyphomicrobium denitrificans 1NES1]|uniref:DUF2007 domain-containing protein n=1 Tax=Hyphomicrobium denitrificans 1NES1 TaxID=670307 RepID=N0B2K1_9HYPH|nr:hypothetical protein [Hyphomicrobium denitrificans]AGK57749.1 hypothetical protein HYPDE_30373 [Hyphomicrobium denitrificans 1NES1]
MPLVRAHTTLMLPEAIVIESLLDAHGIRFALAGKDIISQCPQFKILFGGISFLVDEADLEMARALIADAEHVPGYLSIESAGFERWPVRNAILAFVMLIIGTPFPFWYRGRGSQSGLRP